uniref:KIB1-4 beta-propeller domain-containing protein n=1 Tax=Setaria viridis TaxID=4556 RepID=A0A4U6ULU9_SETVI|nr:hypothetical protein SEVIR_5G211500v2 [Setaria viridis]
MVTEGPPDEDYSGRVLFHSVSSDESHLIQLTALQGKRVAGSGAGLLIGIDQRDDLSGVLVNPLTGKSTALPRLPDCFHGGVTSGFATDHQKINGKVEVIVVVWVWAPGRGPTVALWLRGSDDGWATTYDADPGRFWASLPQHWNRLVTHGPQVLEGELAAAADEEKELANGGTAFLPGSKAVYLVEHEGKVRFLFEYYGYNPEMAAGKRVNFALNDMVGDGIANVDWADAPELQDKAIFRSGKDGACYVIPASDDLGLSKNSVYYFDWRHLEEAEDGGGRTEAFCLCKVDMLEGVDTIVKQVPNPKCRAWETTTWFVPSFKF